MWSVQRGLLALLLASASSAPVLADDPFGRPRWEVNIGGFANTSSTEIRLDSGTLGIGDKVSFEDDLGFNPDTTAFRFDGVYRFGETRRHRIDVSYFDFDRSARKVIEERLQIGDTTFDINADVRSGLGLQVGKVDYSYMFLSNDTTQFGASAGLFIAAIDFSIATTAGVTTSSVSAELVETEDVTLPLPTLGLRGAHNITPRLSIAGHADIFFLEFGNYSGSLQDYLLGLEYQFTPHLAAGIGYNAVDMDLEYTRAPDALGASLDFEGALFYIEISG